ncbi:MAG: dTDP-4-dehydrorhamnose reductase [Actinomycetota bacterium]
MTLRRVLITGGGGQLAADLEGLLADGAEVHAPGHAQLDVTDDAAVETAFAGISPDTVFNCAAFHNVDLCEGEEEQSFAVNCRAVKRLAQLCDRGGAKLVHLSTNYVFDGERDDPYGEWDHPNPQSVYAISKLAGEWAALAYGPGALVVRTAGLYGLHGSASKGGNFVTRMINRAQADGALRVVSDQRLSPTYTEDLARSLIQAVEIGVEGTLHLTASDSCTWHEFTVAIMELAGIPATVDPVPTAPDPNKAKRPLNGVLARPAADAAGIAPLRFWHGGLAEYMQRAGLTAINKVTS